MKDALGQSGTGPLVTDLLHKAASGRFTLHDIWLEASDIGLLSRNGKRLSKQTIVEMLKRRVYMGLFQYGSEEWHKSTFTPLIDADTYDKIQVAMGWAVKRDRTATT